MASTPIRILLLEDVLADAELALRQIRAGGFPFEWRHEHDPEGFERALREFRPDIVLSDFSLPRISGPRAIEIVHQSQPDLPVIILSGTIGEEVAIETLRAGAVDYILKDKMARLVPAIHRALREAQERRGLRHAEDERRASEELHRTLVSALAEGVVVVEVGGRIISSNVSAARILAVDQANLAGRNLADLLGTVTAEDGAPLPARSFPAMVTLRTGEPLTDVFLSLERSDRRRTWLSVSTRSISPRLPSGDRAVVVSLMDVTERRSLEDQLHQSQKLEAIGSLAGGISHDFNNLLTVINGYCDLALADLEGSASRATSAITEVKRAGDRAAALTRQLLAFSRRQILQPALLDLNTTVREMEGLLRRLIGEDVEQVAHLAPELGPIRADPGQLGQVVMNLAVNAREAMPRGGRLIIETANVELDPSYAGNHLGVTSGSYVMLAVTDTGCGMDEATRARIFEPFFTTKVQGTGLGLATVYGIVKQSGGNIWVYSEPGRGTTFKVYFPRVAGGARSLPAARQAVGSELRGEETILLVEDEAALKPLIQRILGDQGYTLLVARDPAEALELAGRHRDSVRLVLTDIVMPGMSGFELLARLREVLPAARALLMSGYTEKATFRADVLPEGMAFLAKPFTPVTLAQRVRETLDRGTVLADLPELKA